MGQAFKSYFPSYRVSNGVSNVYDEEQQIGKQMVVNRKMDLISHFDEICVTKGYQTAV